MKLRHSTISTAICLLAAMAGATPAMADNPAPPDGSVPLLAVELFAMYGNHTWKWGDTGGAYFKNEGREFIAYSIGDDNKASITARGKWRITDKGKLCFDADWKTKTGTYPVTSCYEHVMANGDIYSRSMKDGKQWYIFKHAKADPSDEYNNLVREDPISANLDTTQ